METFIRKELKYVISDEQKKAFFDAIASKIECDLYPECTIFSVYLDTENFDLLRICEGKPAFRQKLRIRAYHDVFLEDDPVFIELKKKYRGTCLKSRAGFSAKEAENFLYDPKPFDQTTGEIAEVLKKYRLQPQFALYAHRYCWKWVGREDLRLTLDDEILWRDGQVGLFHSDLDESLLEKGQNILEIKCAGNLPIELVRILQECSIAPASFSKAGEVYRRMTEREKKYGYSH